MIFNCLIGGGGANSNLELVEVTLTSSQTWTLPDDAVGGILEFELRGPGGGGGTGRTYKCTGPGGGGGGGLTCGVLSAAPGDELVYVHGAYGAKGQSGGNSTLTFNGTTYTAYGGTYGGRASGYNAGTGGAGGAGDTENGGDGSHGYVAINYIYPSEDNPDNIAQYVGHGGYPNGGDGLSYTDAQNGDDSIAATAGSAGWLIIKYMRSANG